MDIGRVIEDIDLIYKNKNPHKFRKNYDYERIDEHSRYALICNEIKDLNELEIRTLILHYKSIKSSGENIEKSIQLLSVMFTVISLVIYSLSDKMKSELGLVLFLVKYVVYAGILTIILCALINCLAWRFMRKANFILYILEKNN